MRLRKFHGLKHDVYDGGNFHRFSFAQEARRKDLSRLFPVDLSKPHVEINVKDTLKSKGCLALAIASTLICGGGAALLYFAN